MPQVLLVEVGAQALRTLKGALHLPRFDTSGVPTEEDVGHLPPLVVGGAGVDRWRKEIVLEGIRERTLRVTDDARQ